MTDIELRTQGHRGPGPLRRRRRQLIFVTNRQTAGLQSVASTYRREMLQLGTTVIGARDTARAARFWAEALHLKAGEPEPDDGFTNLSANGGPVLSV